ncbi:MAG: Ubiquinone/menaquinone biosynthesis C-methyltransferase UbiE [Saprospiraceae bacterium]|jgi:demethylmenaquinone methyltransferase/2-methoxy-6-polyprenyl-1,4-benzoquinol methylase|nr:Ubiquinone/menaquinone biosynthesis C-methyltransferase UbiE [Saprospiraceae bacterium]
MFDRISGSYDFLNSLLSLGVDRYWRSRLIRGLPFEGRSDVNFLDVAAGTGALSIAAARAFPNARICAVDLSKGMLQQAEGIFKRRKLDKRISTCWADAEALPFPDQHFDAVFIAFGVRNFEHLSLGLAEMKRVLKSGGTLHILEFSRPTKFPFKQLFAFYFRYVLPRIGNWWSRDPRAYAYLFESVQHFPDYQRFTQIMAEAGLNDCQFNPLTFGICTLYTGTK